MSPTQQLAHWLQEAQAAIAFTGAGISTESGIPDFRSPGGVWSQNQPVYWDDFQASATARYEYWRQKAIAHRDFDGSKPNRGHLALGKWEQQGRIGGVITQNIDGLHQDAGNRRVWELHGTARFVDCIGCGDRNEAGVMVEKFLAEDEAPNCEKCGQPLKHATISFGQPLPTKLLQEASDRAVESDLFLAMGSSLVVHPAASLPQLAAKAGARLVIINRDPTPLDRIADLVINASIGETLSAVDAELEGSAAEDG